MRPYILNDLFKPITQIQGIGEQVAKRLERLSIRRAIDFLYHIPISVADRRYSPPLSTINKPTVITVIAKAISYTPNVGKQPFCVNMITDKNEPLILSFFNGKESWFEKQFPLNVYKSISGVVDIFNGKVIMSHPDYIENAEDFNKIAILEPIYPLCAGITNKFLRKTIGNIIEKLPNMPEWLDAKIIDKYNLPTWKKSIKVLHQPYQTSNIDLDSIYRKRLALDELLANQISMASIRNTYNLRSKTPIINEAKYIEELKKLLPFSLTDSQEEAIDLIIDDLKKSSIMIRLVQGDVGSGKTLVALAAMLFVVESGKQAVLMAPTEILAIQHYETISKFTNKMGIKTEILLGRDKGKIRNQKIEAIENKEVKLIIGTHAVFQDDINYKDLGLVVIDEQHKFGVEQRLKLLNKGQEVNLLVLTATPIPRSLLLAKWGDMDFYEMLNKPQNRKEIITLAKSSNKINELINSIISMIEQGKKIYWVCPLIEESAKLKLISATQRHDIFKSIIPEDKIFLVHGQIKDKDKDETIINFKNKEGGAILVATQVIEVGIDIPEASIIVIEHAERFGLAQMHQLRGRVGRDSQQSYCILLYYYPVSKMAESRIRIFKSTTNGFKIAEEDLNLRGAGDILGIQQSGIQDFHFASIAEHKNLIEISQKLSLFYMKNNLISTESIKTLVYLFELQDGVRFVLSG